MLDDWLKCARWLRSGSWLGSGATRRRRPPRLAAMSVDRVNGSVMVCLAAARGRRSQRKGSCSISPGVVERGRRRRRQLRQRASRWRLPLRESNCSAMRTNVGGFALAERCLASSSAPLGVPQHRQDGDLSGVRLFGVGFERFGRRRGARRFDRRRSRPARRAGGLARPDVRAAGPRRYDARRGSCRWWPAVGSATQFGEHAEAIAADHTATFVGDGVGRRLQVDVAMDERAESQ